MSSVTEVGVLQLHFFDYLFGSEEGFVCIAHQPQNGTKEQFKQKFFEWPKERGELQHFVEHSKSKANLWFCVNLLETPKRIKQYCKPTNLVWADLDTADPLFVEPPPQVIIQSSHHRYQAIWRVDETLDPYTAEEYSKRIAYQYKANGADPTGWDLTQLLRVPFTYNFKYHPPHVPLVKLIKSDETLIPLDAFNALDLVEEPEVYEYEGSMPPVNDLPDANMVIYKYGDSLRSTQFSTLWAIEPNATDNWSTLLWRLLCICFESGMEAVEVFAIALSSSVNKYQRDGRPPQHLWRDVCKAELAQKKLFAITGDHTAFGMPEIITGDEIAALPTTIVDDYRAWATNATDAVASYHDLCCMVLLSALLAPGIKLDVSYGLMVPNIWGLVLGDSTLTRKSTAMGMAMDFVTDIDRDLILATDGSVEGLLTGLQSRPKMTSIFFRDEVTGLFESFQKKDYMAGMPEMLTQLYDGRFYTRKLRKETITVTDPIFVFFGGGIRDKFYSLISEQYFIGGFLPRFLVVSGDADVGSLRRTGPATTMNVEARQQLLERFRTLKDMYVREHEVLILGQPTTLPLAHEVIFSPDAWERYGEIEAALAAAADNSVQRTLMLPVVERLSRSLLKMACLFAATRQEPQEGLIPGTKEDILQAAKYVQQWGVHSIDLVNNAGRTVFQKTLDKILGTIRGNPGIQRGQIMQHYKLSKFEMDQIHSTLIERGQIIEKKEGRGFRYTAIS